MLRRAAAPLKQRAIGDQLVRRHPIYYRRAAAWFAQLEQADPAERARRIDERLRRMLRAARHTAYGRRVGRGETLESWPLLDKESVRDSPRAFQAPTLWWPVPASTGGTTGMPLQLSRSLASVAAEQVALDGLLARRGLDPRRARIAVLRGDNVTPGSNLNPPFWKLAGGGRRLLMSSNHLSAATVRAYVEQLRSFDPEVLWAYPTSVEALCRWIREERLELKLPFVLTSSEVLASPARAEISAVLGCSITDYYGQAERVALAWSETSERYQFLPGYSVVELIPHSGDAQADLYEIVGTSLWNFAMPLPRYRTGDLVRLPKGSDPHAVARGAREFAGVLGRDGDVLISPEGVRLTGIDHFQRDVARVARIQVVQERLDQVLVRVLPLAGFGDGEREHLLRNARAKLPGSMGVRVECVGELERTGLGKTPFVIRRAAADPSTGSH